MRPITTFLSTFCIGLLSFLSPAFAQTTFTLSQLPATLTVGQTYDLHVTVDGFTDVTTFAFGIDFDETKLSPSPSSTQAISYVGLGIGPLFGAFVGVGANETVNFNYLDASSPNLANGTTILTITFEALDTDPGSLVFHPGSSNPIIPAPEVNLEVNGSPVFLNTTIASDGLSFTGSTNAPAIMGCHIITHDQTVFQGQTITVPVHVVDFEDIFSITYSLKWDPAVLNFVELDSVDVIPGFNVGDPPPADTLPANTTPFSGNVPFGFLPTIWPDVNDAVHVFFGGIDLPDSTRIFNLKFQVIGNPGTSSLIEISRDGIQQSTNAPIYEDSNGEHDLQYIAGNITVGNAPPPSETVTFKLEKDTVLINEDVCVNVSVEGFEDVTNFELGFEYDDTKLTFDRFDSIPGPLGLSVQGLNLTHDAANHRVRSIWNSTNPTTLADGTVIYSTCYNTLGAVNSTADLEFMDFGPFLQNLVGVNNSPAAIDLHDGHVFITDAVPPCVAVDSKDDVNCNGGNDGAINISGTCASGLTYAWSGPNNYTSTSEDISGLSAGDYTVTVTSDDGLTITATETITEPAELTFDMTGVNVKTLDCNGDGTGRITFPNALVMGGTNPYSYAWTGPGGPYSTKNLTDIDAGTYSLIITDANGCTVDGGSHVVNEPAALTMNSNQVSVTDVSCVGNSDGTIAAGNAVSGGTGAYTYAWTGPGGPYSGGTIDNLNAGSYNVVVTDTKGCTIDGGAFTVGQPTNLSINTNQITTTNIACAGSASGSIVLGNAISGGTGGYTYAWSGPNNFTANTKNISSLSDAGCYTFTVTDANGCSLVSSPLCITAPMGSAVTVTLDGVTNESCMGANNGCINITVQGGSQSFTYEWRNANDPSATIISTQEDPCGFAAGEYYVLVYEGSCGPYILSANAVINTNPNSMFVSAAWTNVTCPGGNDGTITLTPQNGTPAYSTTWTPSLTGNLTPTGVTAGTYQAIVSDANGCSVVTEPITVTEPAAIVISLVSKDDVSCNGMNDGSITVSVNGGTTPYNSVVWGGLQGTTINNLEDGFYTPTVTDANGCTQVGTAIEITEPDALVVTLDGTTDPMGVMCDGAINMSVTGGEMPYTYSWSDGNITTQDRTGLCAGSYDVTVTDANNCTYIMSDIVLTAILTLEVEVLSTEGSCSGNDGCMEIAMTGGSAPYVVTWTQSSSGATGTFNATQDTFTYCELPGGLINLSVIDAGSQTDTEQAFIDTKFPPNYTAQKDNPFDDFMDGAIQIFNNTYTYEWDPSTYTGNTLMNLDSGMYVVTVTNPNGGCTSVDTFELERRYEPFDENISSSSPKCGDVCDGSINFFAQGGDGPTYNWHITGPNGFTFDTMTLMPNTLVSLQDLCIGEYTIENIDESNNVRSFTQTLSSQSNITARDTLMSDFAGFGVSGASSCDGRVRVIPSLGISPYEYAWTNGVSTPLNNQLCAGDWEVTVTDDVGCTVALMGTLSAPGAITPTLEVITNFNGYNVSCNGNADGIIQVSAIGGVAPYEIEWSNGQADIVMEPGQFSVLGSLPAGMYGVTLTDDNGISSDAEIEIVEPEPLQIIFSEQKPSSIANCDGEFSLTAPGAAGDVIYTWSRINGAPMSGVGSKIESLCAGHIIQVTAEDENQCLALGRDTIGYPEDGCFQLSPVLTPGQVDGDNDFLIISCIESAKTHHLEIFNRWGQLVFETENYDNFSNTWKGVNRKNQPLPEGVYFYVLDFTNEDDEPMQIKGYVDLIR